MLSRARRIRSGYYTRERGAQDGRAQRQGVDAESESLPGDEQYRGSGAGCSSTRKARARRCAGESTPQEIETDQGKYTQFDTLQIECHPQPHAAPCSPCVRLPPLALFVIPPPLKSSPCVRHRARDAGSIACALCALSVLAARGT